MKNIFYIILLKEITLCIYEEGKYIKNKIVGNYFATKNVHSRLRKNIA